MVWDSTPKDCEMWNSLFSKIFITKRLDSRNKRRNWDEINRKQRTKQQTPNQPTCIPNYKWTKYFSRGQGLSDSIRTRSKFIFSSRDFSSQSYGLPWRSTDPEKVSWWMGRRQLCKEGAHEWVVCAVSCRMNLKGGNKCFWGSNGNFYLGLVGHKFSTANA